MENDANLLKSELGEVGIFGIHINLMSQETFKGRFNILRRFKILLIVPEEDISIVPNKLSNVVLPPPEGPLIMTNSPLLFP